MGHSFGGPWTEIKLDAVQYYLECYSRALTAANMETWYIDAFAGSGDREAERKVGGIFEGEPIDTITETLDGSARRALKVGPPFQHLVFIEEDAERCAALEALRQEASSRSITVLRGDANAELMKLVNGEPWRRKTATRHRGVVFLDPYALHVDWTTLVSLAETKVLDVWYLFPLRDVVRQLSHKWSGIGSKEGMLDRVLSPAWRELYSLPPPSDQTKIDLFDDPEEMQRDASAKQIEEWFRAQLQKHFALVSEPLPILTSPGRQAFSLFLCVGNPSKAATDLAEKFVGHVNRKYAPKQPASRRKSRR